MWYEMRKVGLDFIKTANKTYVMESEVNLPRQIVWEVITDASTWRHWFPGTRKASYRAESMPPGVGTCREALVGNARYEEYMVAWDEGTRWAYYIARSTVPIAWAQLESTELADTPNGTRVRWILATDRRLMLLLFAPIFHFYLKSLWKKAMRNLENFVADADGAPTDARTS